jgi:hypothetical protein
VRLTPYSSPESTAESSIPQGLDMAIYYQATCFFLSSYVLVPAVPRSRGSYCFVQKAIATGDVDRCFTPSFQAASLAALAMMPSHRRLRSLAHAQYLRALREIQKAVQDPVRALSSQTLSSILLLALYEVRILFV